LPPKVSVTRLSDDNMPHGYNIQSSFLAKLKALPTKRPNYFVLIYVGNFEDPLSYHRCHKGIKHSHKKCVCYHTTVIPERDPPYAYGLISSLGLAFTKQEESGTYYVVLDNETPENETPIIKVSIHESQVELCDITWEMTRDILNGKFTRRVSFEFFS